VRGDQIAEEMSSLIEQVRVAYQALGISAASWQLSLRNSSDSYVGSDELWNLAEDALREAARSAAIDVVEVPGDAAFYGPKLDVQVIDGLGREETLSSIQLDFNLPDLFDLRYRNHGSGWERPVMIHRTILSSMERMVAHLLDVHGVNLPPWLAPVQLVLAPINERCESWSNEVVADAKARGIRAHVDTSGALGAKLKRARNKGVPAVAVVGEREIARGALAVRRSDIVDDHPIVAARFLDEYAAMLSRRQPRW
jgi:threonyl-tRNA synthetase